MRATKNGDFAEYSRYPGLDGLEIMAACWIQHSFAPHMHDFYAVSLNYGGHGAFDCRSEVYDAPPGTCNLIAPGDLHTGHATSRDGWSYRNLYIETKLMDVLLRSLDWSGPLDVSFKSPLVKDAVLATRLAHVFKSLSESNSLMQNESLLMSAVARLATDHFVRSHSLRNAGREHAAVRTVRDWLDTHLEQNVSIHYLAELVGLSSYYLVRVFHKHVGITPHRYQTVLRIHSARQLIKSGLPIAEVAYSTGFCDQSHLNRCFKSTLGVPPGKYAANCGTVTKIEEIS
jgi:AraC-like DNA-binding protein